MKLMVEAFRSALSQPVSSVVTALVIGAATAAILTTTGRTIQTELDVLAQIDAAGTRAIIITDVGGAEVNAGAIERIARTSGVEWVVGFGPATEVRSSGNPGGPGSVLRVLHGEPPDPLGVDEMPDPGQGLIGPEARRHLGFLTSYGGVVTRDRQQSYTVAGEFTATDPLDFLNQGIVVTPQPTDHAVRTVLVVAESPHLVSQVTAASLMLLAPNDPQAVRVETSEGLADLRALVAGQLGEFGRQLISLILGAGLVLVGFNVYGTVSARRSDLGRRRALGASRGDIVALITGQTVMTSWVGSVLGAAATTVVLLATIGRAPEPRFAAAVVVLGTLAATLAALPPALVVAYRDPIRVLRIP